MEAKISKVKTKNIAQSAQKLRLIVDLVRGKSVDEALDILEFTNKKGSLFVKKAILSGVANAREQYGVESGELQIRSITVDGAPVLKRGRFASRGRHSVILKRRAHLNLELEVK
ncbi:50S ribosomal protein L22 [bacterium]|nr:50S ribosomal protein L22 [bacterium]